MAGERLGNVEPLFDADRAPASDNAAGLTRKQRKLARLRAAENAAKREDPPAQGAGHSDVVRIPERQLAVRKRIEQRLSVVSPQPAPVADQEPPRYALPPLPQSKPEPNHGAIISFAICVILPVLLAIGYYGFVASNQYVAEFRFTVKDNTPSSTGAMNNLLSMVGGAASVNSHDNYLVADFLTSREAVEELQKRINVVDLYAKSEADWWSRFNPAQPMERFVLYWQKMVSAQYDQITGIATATVRAFTPQDALLVANTMVTLSEELVNKIANRSQTDSVRFAQREVERAEERLKQIRAKMTEYRNRVGVIDPNASVAASNATLIQTLRSNLAQMETQLATLQRQDLQPNAPVIVALKNQIKSTKEQLQNTEAMVGQSQDGSPLSTVMAEYEQLDLERQFAQTMLTSTLQALDQARATAASQHLYITPYVRPSLPTSSTYPRRVLSVAGVGLLAFAIWLIGLLIVRSIRERFA